MKLHEIQQALEALGIYRLIKRASESGGTTVTNVSQGSGGGAWGEITGDIQDQTDLQQTLMKIEGENKRYTFLMS